MSGRTRMLLLVQIMVAVALSVAGVTIYILYSTHFEQQRERLAVTARSQARLIEAVARFDQIYNQNYPEGPTQATLSQIIDASGQFREFGLTGEFTLARREGEMIVFLLRHRHDDLDHPRPVPIDSELAEPMRLALAGKSGSVIGLDYRGETVLAAYEPVSLLNFGIVAKLDLSEIRTQSPTMPVVMMTAYSTESLIREGLQQGAIAVLTKPLDIEALLNFFTVLRRQCSVIIVDDDPNFCRSLGDILRLEGYSVTQLNDAPAVVENIHTDTQVVLLDMKWNGLSGLDLLKEIRQKHADLTVTLVTGYPQEMADEVEMALKAGAHTCLYKPLEIEPLLQLLSEVHQNELARIIQPSVTAS